MSIFNKKTQPKNDLRAVNQKSIDSILVKICPILILTMIIILLVLLTIKLGFSFSSEANHYERLGDIVLSYGVMLHG